MSQIKNKFIESAAGSTVTGVDGAKFRLQNNQVLRARNAANSADIDILKVNASDVREMQGLLSMNSNRITNVTDPSSAQDAATKNYVDNAISGISGFANTTLSNLTSPTAINQDLLSDDGTQSIGLANDPFYIISGKLFSLSNSVASGAALTMQNDGGDNINIDAMSGDISLYSPQALTITGVTSINLATSGSIQAGSAQIKNLADPTDPQDAATKAYVDANLSSVVNVTENKTLNGTDITNQYVDLAHPVTGSSASVNSVSLSVVGGPVQLKTVDYTVSLTGGSGGVTRITFAGDLATGGNAALVSGDILIVGYSY